ncbi:MAG: sigma-70 family RNA polymerase sigma factor [Jiangellaceae bacterium]
MSQGTTFQAIASAEMGRLYALARHLDPDGAEDLVQECLLRAYRSYHLLRDPGAAGGWLRTILTNVWRDSVRREVRTPREVSVDDVEEFSLYRTLVDEDPFPYSDSLHLDFLACFDEQDVRTVLQRLPPLYRVPLVLRYVEGCPTKQVAEALDLPLGTVLSQLHRGRKLFERELWCYAEETGALAGATARPRPTREAP